MNFMSKFSIALLSVATIVLAEESQALENDRLKKLSCVATNAFGISLLNYKGDCQMELITNGIPSSLELSNMGSTRSGQSYINFYHPKSNPMIYTSLILQGDLVDGTQFLNGLLFVGTPGNPLAPVFTGAPWAAVQCQIEIQIPNAD